MRSVFTLTVRSALSVAAIALVAFAARADEPKKFYLVDGQVTEKRIGDLEKRIAELEAEVATLKDTKATAVKQACTYCDNCTCAPGVCPACPAATATSPMLGVLTTTDGRKIAWAGTAYVFVDQPPAAGHATAQTCASGSCQIRQR